QRHPPGSERGRTLPPSVPSCVPGSQRQGLCSRGEPGDSIPDPTGTGSWTTGPSRLYGSRDYGAAVMYDDGKILYVGGGRTTNTAEIIDLNSAAPAWQWTGSMANRRRHLNATVLPTGEMLVTGGSSGITFNDPKAPVHA